MNILEILAIEHLYVLLNISLFYFIIILIYISRYRKLIRSNSHLSIISFSIVRKNIYRYINCDLSDSFYFC